MIDQYELLRQLYQLPYFVCPIISGRDAPKISVSIREEDPIPAGWKRANETKGYYPAGTKRIYLSYDPTRD